MSFFDKAKAAFASARRVFKRVGTDLLKQATHTGKALVGNAPREIGFAEYMQRMLGPAFINGFERAPKRDERGGYQRRAKTTRTHPSIGYRKAINRAKRQLDIRSPYITGPALNLQLATYGIRMRAALN
jgi:hypothetical protein